MRDVGRAAPAQRAARPPIRPPVCHPIRRTHARPWPLAPAPQGQEPQNIDKEFLRLWFRANCDPYNDPVLPEAPAELRAELSRRYVLLYERITGQAFAPAPLDVDPAQRMRDNVAAALQEL